jgi:hypothetical protein
MIFPLITRRDREILAYLTRHGVSTPDQVGRRFFKSQWACYRRLRKLEGIRLLVKRRTWWQQPNVLTPTSLGTALSQVDLPPVPRLVLARLEHDLAVVDLSELILGHNKGASWLTERELRRDAARELQRRGMAQRQVMPPRSPDGMLVLSDGRRIAIELDLTGKTSIVYQRILSAYVAKSGLAQVWWFSPSARVRERLSQLIRDSKVEDVFKVYAWTAPGVSGSGPAKELAG